MPTKVPTPTAEQRAMGLAKAKAARAANTAHAAAHLRRDFMDSPTWDRLAAEYGVQLPSWSQRCTPRRMGSWIGKVGLHRDDFGDLGDWARLNGNWPLRAFVGLMLEERARKDPRPQLELEMVEA